jgi:hypothetical protein
MASAGLAMNSAMAVKGPPKTISIGVEVFCAKMVRYIIVEDCHAAFERGVVGSYAAMFASDSNVPLFMKKLEGTAKGTLFKPA